MTSSLPYLERALVEAAVAARVAWLRYADALNVREGDAAEELLAAEQADSVERTAADAVISPRAEVEAEEEVVRWGYFVCCPRPYLRPSAEAAIASAEKAVCWTSGELVPAVARCGTYRRLRTGEVVDVVVGAEIGVKRT